MVGVPETGEIRVTAAALHDIPGGEGDQQRHLHCNHQHQEASQAGRTRNNTEKEKKINVRKIKSKKKECQSPESITYQSSSKLETVVMKPARVMGMGEGGARARPRCSDISCD